MNLVGYARVSTSGQTLDAQTEQLTAAGCTRIFKEKLSGARADRPELAKAIAAAGPGDVLLVTRLDRLARSTRDLLNIVDQVTEQGAQFRSLAEAWADTTTPAGRLLLTVIGGLAEFERSLIRERTGEGRERARRAGKRLGRPPKLSAYQIAEARRMRAEDKTDSEIARLFGVDRSTISRLPRAEFSREPHGS